MSHIPVLLQEVVEGLAPEEGQTVIDATLGGGGHARALGEKLSKRGHLIGLDQDATAIAAAREYLTGLECQVSLVCENFSHMRAVADKLGLQEVDGILYDLGFSSTQMDLSGRGFSFSREEPLLMTLRAELGEDDLTAREMVNTWSEKELADTIYEYGEERFSRGIAHAIVEARRKEPIMTTLQLVEAIRRGVPVGYTKTRLHFATKTFQALRIRVNDELEALSEGLAAGWSLLKPGGRMAVINFHSLEGRILKHFCQEKKAAGVGELTPKKPILPTRAEVVKNPRSRSAQLRIIKKL